MIGKPDKLRAAVANSRSRSVRTIRSGYIHNIDALNFYIKYHISFQTSSSRSTQDLRRALDLPAHIPLRALHRDHHAAEHRNFDMQPTNLHHPRSLVILVLRGVRHALHPLWILTRTLRGPSPLETWQLRLAAQNCVRSHLCVVSTFYYRVMVRSRVARNHSPRRAHPSRPYPDRKLSIYLCVPPIAQILISAPLIQRIEPTRRFDLPRHPFHRRA
jgi:hypothetical protein